MTEEKKDIKEVKPEEAVTAKEPKKEDPIDADATLDFDDEPESDSSSSKKNIIDTEELPDEIKKKLESRKEEKAGKKFKKKKKKTARTSVDVGKIYVKASYNNTIVTVTDLNGNVISWASAGMAGFKGPKKATSYAAQIIAKIALIKAKEDFGLKEASIFVNGIGTGREAAIRAVNANGINVTSIKDITPIPHNGCRAKKPRRV
jgi:small subunit ribosomal protein S11